MSWTSTKVSQPGNSTLTWSLGPHPAVSTHDSIVLNLEAGDGPSTIQINTVAVVLPTQPRLAGTGFATYLISISVIGPDPMKFRLSGAAID